jgi:hypothetical protein
MRRLQEGHDAKTPPSHVRMDMFSPKSPRDGNGVPRHDSPSRESDAPEAPSSCPLFGEGFRPTAPCPPPTHGQGRIELLATSAKPPDGGTRHRLKHHHGATGSTKPPPSLTTLAMPAQLQHRRRTERTVAKEPTSSGANRANRRPHRCLHHSAQERRQQGTDRPPSADELARQSHRRMGPRRPHVGELGKYLSPSKCRSY